MEYAYPKDLEINKVNFNLLLGSKDSEIGSIVNIFDSLYCDETLSASFRIAILYTIFSEIDIKSLFIRLRIKYTFNGINKKQLYLDIIDDEVDVSDNATEFLPGFPPQSTTKNEVQLPSKMKSVQSGKYFINYSTQFPGFGKYQLELYYKLKKDDNYILSSIHPLTVKQK